MPSPKKAPTSLIHYATGDKPMTFNDWFEALSDLAQEADWPVETEDCPKEAWMDYWQEGDTPEAALAGDMKAAD